MATKRQLPDFLAGRVTADQYAKWLDRKAHAHVKRDRKRAFAGAIGAAYRDAIHAAVVASGGKDAYTGEDLHWDLLSQYDNEESKAGRSVYKASFALLPTVDHLDTSTAATSFRICAWRTNDAKNDLSHESFLELCQRALLHAGYTVAEPAGRAADLEARRPVLSRGGFAFKVAPSEKANGEEPD